MVLAQKDKDHPATCWTKSRVDCIHVLLTFSLSVAALD